MARKQRELTVEHVYPFGEETKEIVTQRVADWSVNEICKKAKKDNFTNNQIDKAFSIVAEARKLELSDSIPLEEAIAIVWNEYKQSLGA